MQFVPTFNSEGKYARNLTKVDEKAFGQLQFVERFPLINPLLLKAEGIFGYGVQEDYANFWEEE